MSLSTVTLQISAAPAAEETPHTPTRRKFVAIQTHTPPDKVHLPSGAKLGSPAKYHDPSNIDRWTKDGKPNKTLRAYLKQLERKPVDSSTLGSATKDPETIRIKRKIPDEQGRIEVTPTRPEAPKRVWRVHANATTDEGIHRIFPCKGEGIVSLSGKDKAALIREHLEEQENHKGNCRSFEEHLRKRVKFVEHQLDTPEKPEAAVMPPTEQQTEEEFKPTQLKF